MPHLILHPSRAFHAVPSLPHATPTFCHLYSSQMEKERHEKKGRASASSTCNLACFPTPHLPYLQADRTVGQVGSKPSPWQANLPPHTFPPHHVYYASSIPSWVKETVCGMARAGAHAHPHLSPSPCFLSPSPICGKTTAVWLAYHARFFPGRHYHAAFTCLYRCLPARAGACLPPPVGGRGSSLPSHFALHRLFWRIGRIASCMPLRGWTCGAAFTKRVPSTSPGLPLDCVSSRPSALRGVRTIATHRHGYHLPTCRTRAAFSCMIRSRRRSTFGRNLIPAGSHQPTAFTALIKNGLLAAAAATLFCLYHNAYRLPKRLLRGGIPGSPNASTRLVDVRR